MMSQCFVCIYSNNSSHCIEVVFTDMEYYTEILRSVALLCTRTHGGVQGQHNDVYSLSFTFRLRLLGDYHIVRHSFLPHGVVNCCLPCYGSRLNTIIQFLLMDEWTL